MRAAPEVSCAMVEVVRARAYRAAENIRHSLRSGFTAYNELSPVSRSFLATVAPEKLISPELDASISGVRTTRLRRTLSRRSFSALPASTATRPTIVAIMIRPSERDGMAIDVPLIWPSGKAKYFLIWGLTRFRQIRSDLPDGQRMLNWFEKMARTGL